MIQCYVVIAPQEVICTRYKKYVITTAICGEDFEVDSKRDQHSEPTGGGGIIGSGSAKQGKATTNRKRTRVIKSKKARGWIGITGVRPGYKIIDD